MYIKKKEYRAGGTILKSNRKIVERSVDMQIHTYIYAWLSPSWLGSATSIISGWVKLVLWA